MVRTHTQRGFTLIELMTVVVIVGVLATLGVYGVRKYVLYAKRTEAIEMIRGIKAAQEEYLDDTHTYLNVSGDLSTYYPMTKPGKTKVMWGGGTDDVAKNWRALGVDPTTPVQYGYACQAGAIGSTPPQPGDFSANIPWPESSGRPWYVVKALGDTDENGIKSVFISSSFSPEIYSENEFE